MPSLSASPSCGGKSGKNGGKNGDDDDDDDESGTRKLSGKSGGKSGKKGGCNEKYEYSDDEVYDGDAKMKGTRSGEYTFTSSPLLASGGASPSVTFGGIMAIAIVTLGFVAL
jgi:hypothetical protein